MKKKTDHPQLLDDVVAEAAPPDFRAALLGQSVRLVRRRRQLRRIQSIAAILALLGMLGIFVWPKNPKQPALAVAPTVVQPVPAPRPAPVVQENYSVIETQPLSATSIITTSPFSSVPETDLAVGVIVVQTAPGNYRIIGDDELLALFAAHPAALVHTGPNSEKLIFANPDDAKGFPAN